MLYVGGMVEGTANSHSLPQGTYFTITHIVLYCKVSSNVVGYGLGPTMARWFLDHGSQDIYALQQAFLTAVTILALELAFYKEAEIAPVEDSPAKKPAEETPQETSIRQASAPKNSKRNGTVV